MKIWVTTKKDNRWRVRLWISLIPVVRRWRSSRLYPFHNFCHLIWIGLHVFKTYLIAWPSRKFSCFSHQPIFSNWDNSPLNFQILSKPSGARLSRKKCLSRFKIWIYCMKRRQPQNSLNSNSNTLYHTPNWCEIIS